MDFRSMGWPSWRLHPDDQRARHEVAARMARSLKARAAHDPTPRRRTFVGDLLTIGREASETEARARGEVVGLLDAGELCLQSLGGDRDMAQLNGRARRAERWDSIKAFLVRFMKWRRG